MSGWHDDPRQQRPATPPQWQQGGPDPWAASAGSTPPQWQQQPQYPQPGYYPPQYPQAPRKKPRKGLAFFGCGGLGALAVLIAVLVSSNSSSSSPPAPAAGSQQTQAAAPAQSTAAAKPAAAQTVTYVVTGSAADVTYGPAGSDSSDTVPMRVTKPLGTPIYYAITAQLQGGGSVTCKIEVDGKTVSASTASGGYNIAQCEISQDPLSGQWTDTNSGS